MRDLFPPAPPKVHTNGNSDPEVGNPFSGEEKLKSVHSVASVSRFRLGLHRSA